MKTEVQDNAVIVFPRAVAIAVSGLKERLQHDYEQIYPDLGEIIRIVLDEEEANAWELSSFPHLLLPDLVEAHIATLGLKPRDTGHYDSFAAPMDAPHAAAVVC
jgi:hypothetical protein